MSRQSIEQQARSLASSHREADPDLEYVLWFPDDEQVRLIDVTEGIPASDDAIVAPFYFRPDPERNLPAVMAIAMVRPGEVGKLRLPTEWGDWNSAVRLN